MSEKHAARGDTSASDGCSGWSSLENALCHVSSRFEETLTAKVIALGIDLSFRYRDQLDGTILV